MSEFAKLMATLEVTAAEKAELQVRIKRGEMVNLEALEHRIVDKAHGVRDLLLYASHRHAALIAARAGLDPARLLATFNAMMRDTLKSISHNGPTDLGPTTTVPATTTTNGST